MTRIGLIDYGMGNLHSVQRAFERLGASVEAVHSTEALQRSDALVLPGVGAFDPAMERLHASGLVPAIKTWCAGDRPLLGICLGLQLLFDSSDEGRAEGLGLIPGHVAALPRCPDQPIPHMGWEALLPAHPSPLLPADSPPAWMYFVHSYAAVPADPACITARVAFGSQAVTAAVWQGSLAACQFHPEKSSLAGTRMLQRWLQWVQQRQG